MSDSVFHANSGGLVFLSLVFLPVYVVILVMAASSIKILREYERAVVFRPVSYTHLDVYKRQQYASAPVWPNAINMILSEAARDFPGKPIIVVENGCVVRVPGFTRADYLKAHVAQVRKAVELGAPVEAYLCWSITSNREWGLTFDDGSDFGLYHVDLDTDLSLTRTPTDSSRTYATLIADSKGTSD